MKLLNILQLYTRYPSNSCVNPHTNLKYIKILVENTSYQNLLTSVPHGNKILKNSSRKCMNERGARASRPILSRTHLANPTLNSLCSPSKYGLQYSLNTSKYILLLLYNYESKRVYFESLSRRESMPVSNDSWASQIVSSIRDSQFKFSIPIMLPMSKGVRPLSTSFFNSIVEMQSVCAHSIGTSHL